MEFDAHRSEVRAPGFSGSKRKRGQYWSVPLIRNYISMMQGE